MGLFSGIKNIHKKAEAVVIVQNLLKQQVNTGIFNLNPEKLANKLVTILWKANPDVFEGKLGQRPNKLTVAASALANSIELFKDNDLNRSAIILSLGNILSEIEVNGELYPFNIIDEKLLEAAISIYSQVSKEFSESDISEIPNVDNIKANYSTWDKWLEIFKIEAGKHNPQLKVDNQGNSLLDFMDHEPLKRAYSNGVDPKILAVNFAAQFNISSFGR